MQQMGHATRDAGIPVTLAELEVRYGDQVETMLAHWLDDEALAARLRRPVLAAVARNGQSMGIDRARMEDWIFGEARREARQLVAPDRIPGVIAVMRRSSQRDEVVDEPDDDWDEEPPRRRFAIPVRWLLFGTFMLLMLAGLGYATVNFTNDPTPAIATLPPPPVPAPSIPAPVAEMDPPAEAPAPLDLPALDAAQDSPRLPPPAIPMRLEPLEAAAPPPPPVPPRLPVAPQPAAPPAAPPPLEAAEPIRPPPVAAAPAPLAVPPEPRIFIHYSAIDDRSAARAEQLAQLLRSERFPMVTLRQVPFGIAAPSVRYFFQDSRPVADRLVRLSSRVLPAPGRLAGRGPSDFTHFSPKPQPGTVEIWLPTG